MLDFTLGKYKELCLALINTGFTVLTVCSYLETRYNRSDKLVVLRHDVDRKPHNALKVAELEAMLGIKSTFYFRYPYTFKYDLVKRILNLGHEIGYHYETLNKARGIYEKALNLFVFELQEYRKVADVKTICAHGNALSKYDNRELWKVFDFKDFNILGEAYLSFDKSIIYFSDTGRNWNRANNVRDFIPDTKEDIILRTTDDLIKFVKTFPGNDLYISAHPERLADGNIEWLIDCTRDFTFNVGKKILKAVR